MMKLIRTVTLIILFTRVFGPMRRHITTRSKIDNFTHSDDSLEHSISDHCNNLYFYLTVKKKNILNLIVLIAVVLK